MVSQSSSLYFGNRNSLKDQHLNFILDKLNSGQSLGIYEDSFLDEYDNISENDLKDFSHLSKNQVFDKICNLLERNKVVICNLYDKYGITNDMIIKIENLFEKDCCLLTLKHGEIYKLYDKFLYKITYNLKKKEYYLESQNEYFEKITNTNEN
jgi:hypothetical protein